MEKRRGRSKASAYWAIGIESSFPVLSPKITPHDPERKADLVHKSTSIENRELCFLSQSEFQLKQQINDI